MLVTAINGCSRLEVTFLENLKFSQVLAEWTTILRNVSTWNTLIIIKDLDHGQF